MALRLVSKKTKRLELVENDWVEVRDDLSRRDFNRIIQSLPVTREGLDTDNIDLETATAFAEALFDVFVTDWSVSDEDGNKVAATVSNYQMLARDSSQLVDEAITAHFNSFVVTDEDAQKSEEPSV